MFGTCLIIASIIQGNLGNFVSYSMVAHDTCLNRWMNFCYRDQILSTHFVVFFVGFAKNLLPLYVTSSRCFCSFEWRPVIDYLRFLWWEKGTGDSESCTYRMTRHLFGAASSPGCANFALRKIATEGEADFGMDVVNFIKRDFYVDEGLKSVSTPQEGVSLINRNIALLKGNGLVWLKFMSNSKEVLQQIPPEARTKGFMNIDIDEDSLPIERTLGIQWCVELDTFQFRIVLNEKPFTRRGLLSTLSSVYDPLGFIAPFILKGKQILQEMCMNQLDWDSPIPGSLQPWWWQWIAEGKNLDSVVIKRWLKPTDFDEVVTAEIHHFSDRSQSASALLF